MVKVERSQPAPESLAIEAKKAHGAYNLQDVVLRLREDFHDKCYICGLKDLQDPEVEHLLPHYNRAIKERVFDWNNLFYSCSHCNGVKKSSIYDEKIIDCCLTDPETQIDFVLSGGEIKAVAKCDDEKAKMTALLVSETFNRVNTGIRIAACQKRADALKANMNALYKELGKYEKNPDSKAVNNRLRVLLSRKSAFAEFKRSYVRRNLNNYPRLASYLV